MTEITTNQTSLYWFDFLLNEFKHETDRAAVVLTVSLFDNSLSILLKKTLVPNHNNDDELFEGSIAPLSSFSSKIHMTYRLGLISVQFSRDLHLIRKIRNEFAHNVYNGKLDDGSVKNLLTTLVHSSDIIKNSPDARSTHEGGSRGDFLMIASLMLYHLNCLIEDNANEKLKTPEQEWIYKWKYVAKGAQPVAQIQQPAQPATQIQQPAQPVAQIQPREEENK